jgi:hypothetical protein
VTLHRSVALQVAFEMRILKPVFSLDWLWVMGLKGYRLRVNLIQRAEIHRGEDVFVERLQRFVVASRRGVALQVEIRKANFETGFSLDM